MVVDMYIISPKKDWFKLVFFSLFEFFKMKRPRHRLQKTNKQSFLVLVLFGLSPVRLQSFASPRTGLSNTRHSTWVVKKLRLRSTSTSKEYWDNVERVWENKRWWKADHISLEKSWREESIWRSRETIQSKWEWIMRAICKTGKRSKPV